MNRGRKTLYPKERISAFEPKNERERKVYKLGFHYGYIAGERHARAETAAEKPKRGKT